MSTEYSPAQIEASWYARWESAGLFHADAGSDKPKYSIAIPPPNVTGELHMGHATNGTVQDALVRYRRMRGYEVLWLPGYDHAAIATQNVLEKRLARDSGTTKEEIGRAAFDELVEEWYRSVGATIISQFRELGASLDLTRLRFTMDPAYCHAVATAFVRFHERGWLYRGPRIVNWCPRCLSAISDVEVEWEEHEDALHEIRYDLEGGGHVVIATVRPETMLGDVAVAVHPEDARYVHLVGRRAILPLAGRTIPIVADGAVERDFGTGVLKVTPGHDPLDHEIGERHGLPVISVMHPDARMHVPDLPRYDGLESVAARALVLEDLAAAGQLLSVTPYQHEVGHCDRCKTVIQPMVSEQWFLSMKDMAAAAIAASEAGRIRWHPERYERTYLDWMRGLKDWCVSRQLWLGHRIPAYTCPSGHLTVAAEAPAACSTCGQGDLVQDPDVLDTWFSSAIWPFATLGWPEETADLRAFYPTDLNSTSRDIINLWVSRMIMTGLEFMGEVPFRDVVIHAVIQATDGRRMSKSLGTGVDPREVIAEQGADALRAWCAAKAMSSQDVRFDARGIEDYRKLGTKLWNSTRLLLMSLPTGGGDATASAAHRPEAPFPVSLADRWILSRLEATVTEVNRGIEEFQFQLAVAAIYQFAWHEFCDWYIEVSKSRLRSGDAGALATSLRVLDVTLRLLHPFMPFITEELWHRLPGERNFLVTHAWPERTDELHNEAAESQMERLMDLVREVRASRKAAGISRGGELYIGSGLHAEAIEMAAEVARVTVVDSIPDGASQLGWGDASLLLPAAEGAMTRRREAEAARMQAELSRVEARLANAAFIAKAPAAVVEGERRKASDLSEAIQRLS